MKSKIFYKGWFLTIIFLFVGAGIIPSISGNFEKLENFSYIPDTTDKENIICSNDGTDWWTNFHHDLKLTGFTSAPAPDTNKKLWSINLGGGVWFSSSSVVDYMLYIGTEEDESFNEKESIDAFSKLKNSIFMSDKSFIEYNSNIEKTLQTTNGTIYCLNAKTGDIKWSYTTIGNVYSCPAVADGYLYVASADLNTYMGELYCFDAITGQKQWNQSIMTGYTSPIVSEGRLYILAINPDDYYGKLLCLDASNGDEIWNHTTGYIDFSLYTAPAISDGKLFFTSIDIVGGIFCTISCLDITDGNEIWRTKLGKMDFGYALSSPTIADGKAYIVNAETDNTDFWTELNCVDTSNGDILWNYTMRDEVDEICFSNPAVAYGNVYFGLVGGAWEYGKLICLDGDDGSTIWCDKSLYAYTLSSPVIAEEKVYVGGMEMGLMDGEILCFNAFDGSLKWRGEVGNVLIDSTPAIVDGCVFVADDMGKVCAFRDVFEIASIKGGLASVKVDIANIGNQDLNDVSYSITVEGGILNLINKSKSETIPILEAQTSDIIRIFPVFGLGKIKISATVSIVGISPFEIKKEGFVLGPFVSVT